MLSAAVLAACVKQETHVEVGIGIRRAKQYGTECCPLPSQKPITINPGLAQAPRLQLFVARRTRLCPNQAHRICSQPQAPEERLGFLPLEPQHDPALPVSAPTLLGTAWKPVCSCLSSTQAVNAPQHHVLRPVHSRMELNALVVETQSVRCIQFLIVPLDLRLIFLPMVQSETLYAGQDPTL